jgi:hypothetical protein
METFLDMTTTAFLKNLCKILGHDYKCMQYVFAEQCTRCGKMNRKINKWTDNDQPIGFEKY